MKIVRVTRAKYSFLIGKIASKKRFVIDGFFVNHLWLPESDVVIVVDEDLEVIDFPNNEDLTYASVIRFANGMEVKQ